LIFLVSFAGFECRLKDVVATYRRAQGHHGSKATSDANYRQHLEKTLASVQGQATPKWAQLRPPDAAGVASARRAKSAGSDSGSDSDADQTPLSKVYRVYRVFFF